MTQNPPSRPGRGSLVEMVLGRNTIIVSIDMSSACVNSKRKFVWFLHVLRAFSDIFMIPFVYINDKKI